MAQYMIHTCKKREWYVKEYLIPSMLEQGIYKHQIIVFTDNGELGNLKAFLTSLEHVAKPSMFYSGTWHLQDDVILSSNFRKVTELNDRGVVQGFVSEYDRDDYYWWSFPCIRIPNTIAADFLKWMRDVAPTNPEYRMWISKNKFDDALFKAYLLEHKAEVTHLEPNIVDHIDYLIGGSVANHQRGLVSVRSVNWPEEDEHLVTELAAKLKARQFK